MLSKLKEARDLIADPAKWTINALARSPSGWTVLPDSRYAVCFCARGALMKVGAHEFLPNLDRHAKRLFGIGVVGVNDDIFLGHPAVMKVFDAAIEELSHAA